MKELIGKSNSKRFQTTQKNKQTELNMLLKFGGLIESQALTKRIIICRLRCYFPMLCTAIQMVKMNGPLTSRPNGIM